jgi:hypothetical protein
MAIIYTYPEINQVEGEDLLLISDTDLHKRPTRSVTVDDLATYIGTVIGVGSVESVDTSNTTFITMTPVSPATGDVEITASLSATGTPDNTKFLRGDNHWAEADKNFVFVQGTPSTTWVIQHNLGKFPSITVIDSADTVVVGEYTYTNINKVTLTFSAGFAGKAYLN